MLKPVLCGGEILLDFISKEVGKGLDHSVMFEKRPGGSIFNVVVALRRLGVPVSFLTKIGGDEFGHGLMDIIKKEKINIECLKRDIGLKTTLAFVAVNKEGKPEFKFYRENEADTMLTVSEVKEINPKNYSMYHFGSISLLKKPASDAYLELFNMFYKERVTTSFDPNIRPSLIIDKKDFLNMFFKISKMVDILKMSDDDLKYITGLSDVKEGLRKILNKINSSLILVTLGKNGVLSYYKGQFMHMPTFDKIKIKETTGCGDAFMAAIIYGLLKCENFLQLSTSKLIEILTFANGVATIVGTRYGASNSMPRLQEAEELISLYHKEM
ncbi:MAG: carbohydrate kinase [Bacteroidetes bacterium]|nr:carbohydrate kinase [Bacteroidota bacterium]